MDMRSPDRADRSSLFSLSQINAMLKPSDGCFIERAFDRGVVGFFDAIAGMGQAIGKIAIVGQQNQPPGVIIEPADGIETSARRVLDQMHNRPAGSTGLILDGAKGLARLVEHDIDVAIDLMVYGCVVNLHTIDAGRDEGGNLAHDRTIDPDASFGNEQLAVPPGSHPGIGEKTLQSNFCTGFVLFGVVTGV